jgi:hypothetical protein
MNAQASTVEWNEIPEEGKRLIDESVMRKYNSIANKYGAEPIPLVGKSIPNTRYKLLNSGTVLCAEPMRWRIKGVIPERGTCSIYGPSGSAKTFLALDMAFCVSNGARWFGHKTKSCPVVYVCLEGEAGLSVRLAAYASKAVLGRKVHFVTQPISLLVAQDVRDLIVAISAYDATDGLVIIDTLNRAAPGMDENSSVDMGRAIHAVKQIQQSVGGLVMLVHHTGKDATKGMRGHSSLHGALDAAIEVRRNGDSREWLIAKAKDNEDGTGHPFRLETVTVDQDEDGDPVTSCVIHPIDGVFAQRMKPLTPLQKSGMDTFMAAASRNLGTSDGGIHAHLNEWRTEFFQSSTAETQDGKRSSFSKVRKELIQLGKLTVQNDVYSLPVGFSSIASGESKASR